MSRKRAAATLVVLIFAAALSALPAAAEESEHAETGYARMGLYAGAGVQGGVYTQFDDQLKDSFGGNFDTDTAVGFDVFAGYRVYRYVAAELEFEMLPAADTDVSGLGKLGSLATWAFTTNLKLLPLAGRVQPFALAGIGALHAKVSASGSAVDESDADFAARFGGGVDVYVTDHIVVWARSTYVLPTGSVDFVDYVDFGGGLQYRF